MSIAFSVRSRRAAYAALAVLTLIWALNWIAMKAALLHAHPLAFNVQRTWLAIAVLFGVLIARRRRVWPHSWRAVLITAFFQTTINFGATTMAVAGGGAGRTSVLVFTMPFWTLLLAWPILHERCAACRRRPSPSPSPGCCWSSSRGRGRAISVPKLWAMLSGFGWAAGTIAMKYFQRDRDFDMPSFIAWQMAARRAAAHVAARRVRRARHAMERDAGRYCVIIVGVVATAGGFLLWMEILRWLPAGTASLNMFADSGASRSCRRWWSSASAWQRTSGRALR